SMYDASLDQFVKHSWEVPNLWAVRYMYNRWNSLNTFSTSSETQNYISQSIDYIPKEYDRLVTSADMFWYNNGYFDKTNNQSMPLMGKAAGVSMQQNKLSSDLNDVVVRSAASMPIIKQETQLNDSLERPITQINIPVQIRRDFNETAFFFPQLHADSAGNFSFSFNMPESLTQWKWMSLAHTKDLAFGYSMMDNIVTQKKLMVQPNMPRFLREGDRMEFSTKISNMSDSAVKGVVSMQLFDAETMQPVDGLFNNVFPDQYFSADAGKSISISFPVQIPFSFLKPLTWRFVAKTNTSSDGEENTLPVLSNRMLVTESLPLFIKGDTTQHFVFEKLANNTSATLQTQSVTVEYTANPAWYAVQALPYLAEFPYECAEQLFNRYYANSLAGYLLAQYPRIKDVIEKWQADSANAKSSLLSNLQKNEALKQILLEETPWVLNAENENAQKKNIALLFDMNTMQYGLESAMAKLEQSQMASGGFSWFKGGREDRYITQYILTGIGRLKKLHALRKEDVPKLDEITRKALTWLDNQMVVEYNDYKKNKITTDYISQFQVQY
ncbi:MAG: alpha-2-macroglobulin family protein, partial [Chitinophagaceae bacterium]